MNFVLGIATFAYSFCSLENTCWRVNASGTKVFRPDALVGEAWIGPLRSIAYSPVPFQTCVAMCDWWNPWVSLLMCTLLVEVLKKLK